MLYPYRIITLGSNKHNGDDALWSILARFIRVAEMLPTSQAFP